MPLEQPPHVAVIGSGAMGGLFGGLLANGGLRVSLVDIWREHVDAINARGLRIVGHGGERTISVKATTDARSVPAADIILFQCKAFDNDIAARSAHHLVTPDTAVITFQNGLGNEEALGSILGADHVLAGLTAQGAVVMEPGVVHNFGDLPSYIGELSGGLSQRATAIAATFTRHALPTFASANIRKDKWQKLLGNVALGAISAATGMTSAEMVAIDAMREIILRALDEAASVAAACGYPLGADEKRAIFDRLTDTSNGGTGSSKSSMARDIAQSKRTEIDHIHGAVTKLGRAHHVPTPTIDTMIAVIKGLEAKSSVKG